jgi:polysaccharide transporter, PST family
VACEPETPGLRALAAKGAMFVGVAQAYRVVVLFVANIVLIRLLAPEDFGLVAMVTLCVTFVTMLQDLGLNQATIQREHISQAQMSGLFWLSAGFSAVFAAIFAASAPALAWFFAEPRLIPLTLAFAGLVLLSGFQMQQLAYLNRNMRFESLALIEVLAATANALFGIGVAWATGSYWALFVAQLAATVAMLAGVWTLSGWRPGWPGFEGQFREIMSFGTGISGFNIVNYFARNADNLLIGRFYGAEPLGFYDRAYKLLLFPLTQIQGPLGRVMLPVLSRLQNEPGRYRNAYTECVTLMMLAVQPGLVFLIVFAEDVFQLLFGPQWLPAAPIFRWLGVIGLVEVFTSTVGWVFVSQGRGGDFFRGGFVNAVVTVASFVAGLPWGALGVAIGYTVSGIFWRTPYSLWLVGRRGPLRLGDCVKAGAPHAIAAAASAVLLVAVNAAYAAPGVAECVGLMCASYAVYTGVLLTFRTKRSLIGSNVAMLAGWLRSPARS